MRAFLLFVGSVVGSFAFQITVAIWPDKLHSYAWIVKYVWIVWAVIWLLWLMHWWTARQYERKPAAPAAVTADDFARTSAPPTAAIEPNPPSRTFPRVAQQRLPREEPNLIFLNARTMRVTYGMDEAFRSSADLADPPAVVACFRNEPVPGRRVVDAEFVKAQVLYRDARGEEIGNGIPSACWLDNPAGLTNFQLGESHCVILVVGRPDGSLAAPWKARRTADDGWGGDVETTEAYDFDGVVNTIELRLIGERNEVLLVIQFDCAMADGKPHAVRRQ